MADGKYAKFFFDGGDPKWLVSLKTAHLRDSAENRLGVELSRFAAEVVDKKPARSIKKIAKKYCEPEHDS